MALCGITMTSIACLRPECEACRAAINADAASISEQMKRSGGDCRLPRRWPIDIGRLKLIVIIAWH